jgi:3-oxoacyl-[acyl-carrier protein] reductase
VIDTRLKNKVVCVTGANNPHGIGAATARAFAAQGASVFVHYFRQGELQTSETPALPGEDLYWHSQALDPEPLLKELKAAGVSAGSWEADLGTSAAAYELLERVEQMLGSVDVLVNNAAWSAPDTFKPNASWEAGDRAANTFPMCTLTAESHDRHFAVNSRAPALLMADFARRHIQRRKTWGRIVNVSTDAASGYPDEVSYWASKHALESYSRAAAGELGQYGVTVNIASLGPIQTGWISRELESKVAAATPLGRVGEPEDAADVIVFLASEQARWLTGQLIYVGGGHRMSL